MRPFNYGSGERTDCIRPATADDYAGFLALETEVWKDTGIEPIDQATFTAWCDVFAAGNLVAIDADGNICGHIYAFPCHFDLGNEQDRQRDFRAITGADYSTRDTFSNTGNALYVVSFSAIKPGYGAKLCKQIFSLADTLGKEHCIGSCRLPGFAQYCEKNNLDNTTQTVNDYVALHTQHTTLSARRKAGASDPVLSVLLRCGVSVVDVIGDFLYPDHDHQSGGWGCLIAY